MSGWETLRKANHVAFALLMLLLIPLVAMSLWWTYQTNRERNGWQREVRADPPSVQAQSVSNGANRYNIYWRDKPLSDGARENLSIVSMQDGSEHRLTENPAQAIYGFDVLQVPGSDMDAGAVGYIAELRNGGTDKAPQFDLVIGRLSPLGQTVAVRGIRYLDTPTMLDSHRVSMIVTDPQDQSTFRIFDLERGAFELIKPLDSASGHREEEAGPEAAAPVGKFGF